MKRLFYQSKIYDYKTREEAETHIAQMTEKGWHIMEHEGGRITFLGEDFDFKYTVEFYKEA